MTIGNVFQENPPFALDVVPHFSGVSPDNLPFVVLRIYDLAAEKKVEVEVSADPIVHWRSVSFTVAIRSRDPESASIEDALDALRRELTKERLITA